MSKQSNNISIEDIFNNTKRSRIDTSTNEVQKKLPSKLDNIDNIFKNTKRKVKHTAPTFGKEIDYNPDYIQGLTKDDTENIDQIRGERQGTAATLGAAGAQIIPKIALEVVGSIGHLLDFEAHYNTITGEGDDYSNALTEFAKEGRESIEDWAPIYKKNPNALFDPLDFASYVQTGTDLAANLSSFAVAGVGIAGALGKGASLMAKLTKAGATGRKLLNFGEVAGTAIGMSSIEGSMVGADVYEQTYDEALIKMPTNLNPFEESEYRKNADKVSKEAAGSAATLNAILTVPLNLTGAGTAVRSLKSINKINPTLKRKAGEGVKAWKSRLSTEDVDIPGFRQLITESGQEGFEEILNELATTTGKFKGRKELGLLSKEEEDEGLAGAILKSMSSDETKLAFILGAIGGGGQHLLISKLGAGTENKQLKLDIQTKQVDFLIKKIDEFQRAEANIEKAAEIKDETAFRNAQATMFNAQVFDSFVNGAQEELTSLYQDIANLSSEDAAKKGYDVEEDSRFNYKAKAASKIKEIKELSGDFENIMARYNENDTEASQAFYGEQVFATHLEKHALFSKIKENQEKLEIYKAKYEENNRLRGTNLSLGEAQEYANEIKAAEKAVNDIDIRLTEIKTLDARTTTGRSVLMDKYGKPAKGTTLKQHSINQAKKATSTLEKRGKAAQIKLNKSLADFKANSEGTEEEWNKALLTSAEEREAIIKAHSEILGDRAHLEVLEETYRDLVSAAGKASHISNSQKIDNKRRKDKEDEAKQEADAIKVQAEKDKRGQALQKDIDQKKARERQQATTDSVLKHEAGEPLTDEEINSLTALTPEEAKAQREAEAGLTEEEESTVESADYVTPEVKLDGEVENSSLDNKKKANIQKENRGESNNKIVQGASTFAYLSKGFSIVDGVKKTTDNIKNEDLHKELESSKEFQVGSDVSLKIDQAAIWKDSEGNTVSYKDFVDAAGNIDTDNVPIGISKGDKVVAYVRTQKWLNAKDDAGEFINVANSNDKDSPHYGNAINQIERNKKIREYIVTKGATDVKIINKSNGQLSKNTEGNALLNAAIPNVSTLTIVKDAQFYINKDEIYSNKDVINGEDFISNLNDYSGIVFASIPTPVKGKTLMVPLQIPMLSEQKVDTIFNALLAKFNENKEQAAEVFTQSGHSIMTDSGMLDFLRTHTHTLDENIKDLLELVGSEEGSLNSRHLNYSTEGNSKGAILYARHGKGMYSIDSSEALLEQETRFKDFLREKLISVKLSKLNVTEELGETNIGNDGTVITKPHASYNEYLKSQLSTDILSTPINETEDSYFDQPTIEFSTPFLEDDIITEIVEEVTIEEDSKDPVSLDDFEQLFGDSSDLSIDSKPDDSVIDYSLDEEKKALIREGLEGFLVIDTQTGIPYNTYKQTQVINSITFDTAKGLQASLNLKESFGLAKKEFVARQAMLGKIEQQFDNVDSRIKERLNIKTVDEAAELKEEFEKVIRNWESFVDFSAIELANTFGIKKTINDVKDPQTADDILGAYENLESMLEKISFDDGATFQTNHKDTASARFKLFLSLQKDGTLNYLGMPSFIPLDTVWEDIQMILAGNEPSYNDMITALTIKAASKSYLSTFITRLENQSKQIKNEFVVAFSKQYNPYETLLWSTNRKTGEYVLNPISSNRNSITQRIESEWVNNQKTSSIVMHRGGELLIDPIKAKEFEGRVSTLKSTLSVPGVKGLLEMVGIDMPLEAVTYLKNNSKKLTGKTFEQHFVSGIFYHMSTALNRNNEAREGSVLLELNNPLTGSDREGTSIRILADITAEYTPSIYSHSHKDIENKTIYSYSLNSHISHQVRRLQENGGDNALINGLLNTSYSKYSYWAKQLKTGKRFRDIFSLSYVDGIKKERSGQLGVKRKSQSDREMTLQSLGLFQNKHRGQEGQKISKFIYPTISDKTTTPVITAIRHNIKVNIDDNLKYSLGPSTRKEILDLVKGEIDRIENYISPSKEDAIAGYDNGGALLFYNFPALNDIVSMTKDAESGRMLIDNKTELFDKVFEEVHTTVLNTLREWRNNGIVTDTYLMMDTDYLRSVKKRITGEAIQKQALFAALDFEINYMIANANVLQLITGDPALHFKKDIKTTLVAVQKRLSKDIAPGLDGAFDKDTYKVVYLKDKETNSIHLNEYTKVLGDKVGAYKGIEGTDAQEYTTLKEHLDVMFAYGKLSQEQYNRMQSASRLSKEDLSIILQPMKPVYVNNEVIPSRDVNKITYIKSSSFPLIPQLTANLEIDKLRKEMESKGIARASYISASKLGSTKVVNMWNQHTLNEDFSLEKGAVVLSRKGFRIQQEIPYKESKTKVLTVSQMNKLLFEGILDIPGMKELQTRKEEIRKDLFDIGTVSLFDRIGIEINEEGEFWYKDLTKIKKALEDEAVSRGYSINDIQSLELTEDNKSFKIPLMYNASSKKFESLLLSLITNTIIKQKMPGKSYVQGSSAGFITDATTSKEWSELTDKELGGITWVGDVNMNTGLKFIRKEGKDVRGAQLLVPFYFRDSEGTTLNIKDYTIIKEGKTYIDDSKIDSDLLRMIGARIPNQGHSSMLPIEIAGFLPQSMGDLVIVPDEITAQMGSDFDVDKLTTYNYNYTTVAGKLSKTEIGESKEGLQNEYIDIHWKVLTHPKVLSRVLTSLDQTGEFSLAGEANVIDNIRTKDVIAPSPLFRSNQQIAFMQNRAGKLGVALFSLASTFNATIQDKALAVGYYNKQGKFIPRPVKFKGVSLYRLSGVGNNSKGAKSSVISDIQSAAVDNAKEQRLDKVNLNTYTFAAANALAQLEDENGKNVDIKYITRLLSQRIIQEYVNEAEKLDDSTIEDFVKNKKEEAFKRVSDKYNSLVTSTENKTAYINKAEDLSPDLMLEMIKGENDMSEKEIGLQLKALSLFMQLDEIGSGMSVMQGAINVDSQGAGKDLINVADKVEKINRLGSHGIVGTEALLDPETEIGKSIQLGPILANKLYSNIFPYSSPLSRALKGDLLTITGKDKLTLDNQERLFRDVKGFIYSTEGMFEEGDVDSIRTRLLIDNSESGSLAQRVEEAKKTWGSNNFLLQRLSPKYPNITGNFSTVEYIASAGARLDEKNVVKAFIDMMISEDTVANQLAEDLVTYSYLTASSQGSSNFLKFIPTMYLNTIGASDVMREFNWNSLNTGIFLRQFIQHNPDLAPKIPEELEVKNKFTVPKVGEDTPIVYTNMRVLTPTQTGESLDYPEFVQARNDKNNGYSLFERSLNDDGSSTYNRISTLGGDKGLIEYNKSKSNAISLLEVNKAPNTVTASTNIPNPTEDVQVANREANTNLLSKYKLKEGSQKAGMVNALDIIATTSDDSSYRLIADILYQSAAQLPNLRFTTKSSGKGSFIHSSKDNIGVIGIKMSSMPNALSFENTYLHEVIHAYTSELIDKKPENLSPDQRRAVKSLDALRLNIIEGLDATQLKEFKAFKAKYEAFLKAQKENDVATLNSIRFNTVIKGKYYGLVSNNEFVTMAMTDRVFQTVLNDIPFTGNKSSFVRFKDIIAKLLKSMGDALGIKIKSGSSLEQAVNDIVDLIETTGTVQSAGGLDFNITTSTEYSARMPMNVNKTLRKEFTLLNSSGLPSKLSYERAFETAKSLNTTNKKFKGNYGIKYKAVPTKIPGEKGDSKTYWNVRFELRAPAKVDFDLGIETGLELDSSIEILIKRIKGRILSHRHAMSDAKADKAVYQDKIDTLEGQIERLKKENNIKLLSNIASSHLTWVSNTLDKETISTSELEEAYNTLSVWRDLKRVFEKEYSEGGAFKDKIAYISNKADDLVTKWERVAEGITLQRVNESSSRNVNLEHIRTMVDMSMGSSLFLDLSAVDNPYIAELDKILKRTIRDTNFDFNDNSTSLNKAVSKFKESAEYKANKYDKLLQKDAKGNWTGGITVRYSQKLYTERAKRRSKLDKSKKSAKDYKDYYRWVKANETFIDSRLLFNQEGTLSTSKHAISHKAKLEQEFGTDRTEELILEAKDKFEKYLLDKEAITEEYETKMLDADYTQKEFDRDLSNWTTRNSPQAYLASYEGSNVNTNAKGWDYVVTVPKKVYDSGKKTPWYDKNFEAIQSSEELKEFYTFYSARLKKMMSNLPAHTAAELQSNFLPVVKKGLLESFGKGDLRGALQGLASGLVDELTSVAEGSISLDRDLHTGRINQRIPVGFTETSTEAKNRSKDLGQIMEAFTMTSLNYKHKSKSQDTILVMQRLINEAIEQKINSRGGNAMDAQGSLYKVSDGLLNLKAAVDHAIKATLYNDKREKGADTGAVLSEQGAKASFEATRLASKIKALNVQAALGNITDAEHSEKTLPLQERLIELKGRNVTTVDLADSFMKITQMKGMAYNVFASSNNMTFGLISNILQAAGGEDYTFKQSRQAFTIMLNSTIKSAGYTNKQGKKIAALMDKFDVLFEVDDTAYRGSTKSKKAGISRFTPYEMQRRSEYFVQGQQMVAVMLNRKVKTLEGTETSLFEAFDENGEWKSDIYGANKGWEGDINKEGDLMELRKLQDYFIELNKVVHGNYDPASFPRVKRYMLGRFALQFRSWLAESLKRRMGAQSYNEALGRHTKGFYKSIAENPLTFLKLGLMQKEGLSNLSAVDQANLKKGMVEVITILGLMSATLLLRHLSSDDEDKSAGVNILLNQLYRLESDMTFYISPGSFNRILSSPIPAISTYLDAEKAIDSSIAYILQGEEEDARSSIDAEKVFTKWAKVFPIVNQPMKFKSQAEKVFN